MQRHPLPPFSFETAVAKARAVEEAWNLRNPQRVVEDQSATSTWRDRLTFLRGHHDIATFLSAKWSRELHHRVMNEMWVHCDDRIALRFECEWQHAQTGQWFRTQGDELLQFDADGYVTRRDTSANDIPITTDERRVGI